MGCACFVSNCSAAKTQSININVNPFGSLQTSIVLAGRSLGQAQCAQLQANNSKLFYKDTNTCMFARLFSPAVNDSSAQTGHIRFSKGLHLVGYLLWSIACVTSVTFWV